MSFESRLLILLLGISFIVPVVDWSGKRPPRTEINRRIFYCRDSVEINCSELVALTKLPSTPSSMKKS